MRVKVCPLCPACRAPHNEDVDPGTKITCPDCAEVYRAEAPEPVDAGSRPRDRSATGKKPVRAEAVEPEPADKKKRPRKGDKLGKLIERYAPAMARVKLWMGLIVTGLLAAGAAGYALAAAEGTVQAVVLGVAGGLAVLAVLFLVRLKFGPSNAFFEVHKKGVRFVSRGAEQFLYWEEMEEIDIQRTAERGGRMSYEVHLIGSEEIHLTPAFMSALDDPHGLIKALKEHSGRDFSVAVG